MSNSENNDLFQELVSSCLELLAEIEHQSILLEKAYKLKEEENQSLPEIDPEIIHILFRQFHTIKGNCGFFGLSVIVEVSHSVESILNYLRNQIDSFQPEVIDLIMDVKDYLEELFEYVRNHYSDVAYKESSQRILTKIEVVKNLLYKPAKKTVKIQLEDPPKQKESFGLLEDPPKQKESFGLLEDPPKQKESFGLLEDPPKQKEQAIPKLEKPNIETEHKYDIRIGIDKLDTLIEMIGELVISSSLVTEHQDVKDTASEDYKNKCEQLTKAIKNIQDISLSLRMVPIHGLFQKMERLVRDLSRKSNKTIELELKGGETEVDRNIVEYISDPLVHLLRNAIDHGIESMEERTHKGKPQHGKIILEAWNSEGEIIIHIKDDGKGLDRNKILKTAESKGLLTKDPSNLSESQILDLIFLPGFSTADKVTDISGRGVGMDVVKKNVTHIGGDIKVESKVGFGTNISLRLPLTLSIIEGLVAIQNQKHFILPAIDVLEVYNIHDAKVEKVNDKEFVIQFRGHWIPIVSLEGLISNGRISKYPIESNSQYLIVVESKQHSIGIVFDGIAENRSIVVKPLPYMLKELKEYSGCTILGSGDTGMILDLKFLIHRFVFGNRA